MPRSPAKPARYRTHPLLDTERWADESGGKVERRSYGEWVALARRDGPRTEKALGRWLRTKHGLGSMHATWLAMSTLGETADYHDPESLVDALYSGKRAALRPVHEAVVDVILTLGDDVTVTACQTMVPAYRKYVFAQLAPVGDGVQVRMSLGEARAKGRLARSSRAMPGERLTHEVVVSSKGDVDAELRAWLAQAYEAGAGRIARSTEFETPTDLAKGIARSKAAKATWDAMTPAMRRDMAQWITSAKQAATRETRLARALAALGERRKRVY